MLISLDEEDISSINSSLLIWLNLIPQLSQIEFETIKNSKNFSFDNYKGEENINLLAQNNGIITASGNNFCPGDSGKPVFIESNFWWPLELPKTWGILTGGIVIGKNTGCSGFFQITPFKN